MKYSYYSWYCCLILIETKCNNLWYKCMNWVTWFKAKRVQTGAGSDTFLKELPASTKCIDKYIRQTHCSRFYHILYFNFTNQHASSVGECLRPCRIGILLSVNSSLTNLGTYSQKPKTKTQLFFDKNNAL